MAFNRTTRTLTRPIMMLATLVLFLCGLVGGGTALAQAPTFGLRPQEAGKAYFEHTIAAGTATEDVIVLNNPNDAPLLLDVWVARGATMAAGGITFSDETNGPAEWVTLPGTGSVELAAQTAMTLPFTVAVPAGTAPGEYVVGFLATQSEAPAAVPVTTNITNTAESGFKVIVVSRVAVALIITVPVANRCEALIKAVDSTSADGRWRLAIAMENSGNVHFKGTGEVIAQRVDNDEVVAQSPFTVGYFIPGDAIEYPHTLEPYPAAGDYEIAVTLVTDCGYETKFTQPLTISDASVEQAAAEVIAQNPPSAASGEAAKILAQAELMRSMGLLLAGVAALVVAAFVVFYVMRRRKVAEAHLS